MKASCCRDRAGVIGGLVAGLALAAFLGWSHTLPISRLTLVPGSTHLHLEFWLNPFELIFFGELDTNGDGRLTPTELEARQAQVSRRVLECLSVAVDDRVVIAETAGFDPVWDGHHIVLRAHYRLGPGSMRVTITSRLHTITGGAHTTQVTWRDATRTRTDLLSPTATQVTYELPDRPQPTKAVAAP